MRSQWEDFLVHAFISSSAAVIMPECAIYSPRSARPLMLVWAETEEIIQYALTINHCLLPVYQDLATFYLKGAVDNCCCSNKNHIADKILMAWYLWHVHVQDVITSCYKWIAVPEFDRTHSSFYRDIWLVANCYLWQSWWRDSDHHCDHVTSLTPEHTLLSPWFSFLSCPLQKKTGTWRESCQQDRALPQPSQEAAVFRIFTDMLVAWCKN